MLTAQSFPSYTSRQKNVMILSNFAQFPLQYSIDARWSSNIMAVVAWQQSRGLENKKRAVGPYEPARFLNSQDRQPRHGKGLIPFLQFSSHLLSSTFF